MVRMQWWAYLLMLMVYICYLLIGAAVFQKLESPFEEKRCTDAKAKVKDKNEEFGNEVFELFCYSVGSNLCHFGRLTSISSAFHRRLRFLMS